MCPFAFTARRFVNAGQPPRAPRHERQHADVQKNDHKSPFNF
jgi:hypothetical protein